MNFYFLFGLVVLSVAMAEGRYCASDGFWPQTKVYEEVTMGCDSGTMSRMCMGDMQWGRIKDHNCECVPSPEVPVEKNVKRGDHFNHQCDRGFIDVYCNITGTWDVNNIISNNCFCNRKEGFPMTETENYGEKTCTVGKALRLCDFGKWDSPDYTPCFNFRNIPTPETYKDVHFEVTPSPGYEDVEICILPVSRSKREVITINDIKTRGLCTKDKTEFNQYLFKFELEPDNYIAYIYAHSDHTFVTIPALSAMLVNDHYEFQFSMQSGGNVISFVSSDSYSITIANEYIWAHPYNPILHLYYTNDLSLKLKDINRFQKKTYAGVRGLGEFQFTITKMSSFMDYQFYLFVDPSEEEDPEVRSLVSNRLISKTYDLCREEPWPEVGVNTESTITCSIGFHGYYCTKDEEYRARFDYRRDPCYCPEEIINGITWPKTQYNHTASYGSLHRYCGWRGIWDPMPSQDCLADGEWPYTSDGQYARKTCQNQGQLSRQCIHGTWGPIIDLNCKCPAILEEDVQWRPANREETVSYDCMSGTVDRTCSFFGWWQSIEDKMCICTTDNIWNSIGRNQMQTAICGAFQLPDNKATRQCGGDGNWKEENNEHCSCDTIVLQELIWPKTQAGETTTVVCQLGMKRRDCNSGGMWDDVINDLNCMCDVDGQWPATPAYEDAQLPCPEGDSEETMSRHCRLDGTWGDIDSHRCYGSCPAFGSFPVTPTSTTASVECEQGGGRILMDCLFRKENGTFYGEWDLNSWRVEGECSCRKVDEFPSAAITQNSTIVCGEGTRTQMCGKYTAHWEEPINNECICIKGSSSIIVKKAPWGELMETECDEGSQMLYCGNSGQFEVYDASQCYCSADGPFNTTLHGVIATTPCPEKNNIERLCNDDGFWEAVSYGKCMCIGIPPVTPPLPVNSEFYYQCPVGDYDVMCSGEGETGIRSKNCSCPAVDGFPVTKADTYYKFTCSDKEMSGYCNHFGEWQHVINPCFCEATPLFPRTPIGSFANPYIPSCYRGYCNPNTLQFVMNYDQCGCVAEGEWPSMRHNETITRECPLVGGSRSATCLNTVRRVTYDGCGCIDKKANYVNVGDYGREDCMVGYILQQCRGNGLMFNITDAYCGCASEQEGLNLFENMLAGEDKTVKCGSGTTYIQCGRNGFFDMDSWVNNCKCPKENMWDETQHDQVANVRCSGSVQVSTRQCSTYGIWGLKDDRCMCPDDGEWSARSPGKYELICPNGVKIERECNVDGTWENASGSCLGGSCPADGPFPITPHQGSFEYVCENGVRYLRTCNNGIWSPVDWSQCGCVDTDGWKNGEFIGEYPYSTYSAKSCGEGEALRECRYGVWQEINYSRCFCKQSEILPMTHSSETITKNCNIGSITATCGLYGAWEIISDSCGCKEDSDTVDEVVFPNTPRGETISVACSSGFMTRKCGLNAEWEDVNYADCMCHSVEWEDAHPLEQSVINCQEGSQSRFCKANGFYANPVSNGCACSATDLFSRTVVDHEAVHYCDSGAITATCNVLGWSELNDSTCYCRSTVEYPRTHRKDTAVIDCGSLKTGQKSRECARTGYWSEVEDTTSCVNYCIPVGEWNYTRPGETAIIGCSDAYSGGYISRRCHEDGLWENGISECIPKKCPPDDGYPQTNVNGIATKECPDGFMGEYERRCYLDEGEAVWDEVINTCQIAFCLVGTTSFENLAIVSYDCGDGQVGLRKEKCVNGIWEEYSNTCVVIECDADTELGTPSGVFNDRYFINCGIDYTGVLEYRCGSKGAWELYTGECKLIDPILRCEPADGAVSVPLGPLNTNEQFNVYCTSNIRIKEVINDQMDHMNIHVLFEHISMDLSYPTIAVALSEYTYGFLFDGYFPPKSIGSLYIHSESFVSYQGVKFPSETMVQTFSTEDGTPLAPQSLSDDRITILSVNYTARTVDLMLDFPFDLVYYDAGEVVFPRSNLHSIVFTTSKVVVSGVIINHPLSITWRVRIGSKWSSFASFFIYQPVVYIPPEQPEIVSYNANTITWSWSGYELYGHSFSEFQYVITDEMDTIIEGSCDSNRLTRTVPANHEYHIKVAVCSIIRCSPFSVFSRGIYVTGVVYTPNAPMGFKWEPLSSSSARFSWEYPESDGGMTIEKYVIRRSTSKTMTYIEEVYETSNTFIELTNIKETIYVEIASKHIYTSEYAKSEFSPVKNTASWSTNDREHGMDNAILLRGEFKYSSTAECVITAPAYPLFRREISFPASLLVERSIVTLIPDTTYVITCNVYEVGSTETVHQTLNAYTIASDEFLPEFIVEGSASSSLSARVRVTPYVLGKLSCFISLYTSHNDRPKETSLFTSLWAQHAVVDTYEEPVEMQFSFDVNGELFNAEKVYHAWCLISRDLLQYYEDEPYMIARYYPDYTHEIPATEGFSRQALQVIPFEITAISPALFAVNVDPSSDIELTFSATATFNKESIVVETNFGTSIMLAAKDIQCVENKCILHLNQRLSANENYSLNVEEDAFVHEEKTLEKAVENHVFATGEYRCNTKYVSKGLASSKLCSCFSESNQCQCECGETQIMRYL